MGLFRILGQGIVGLFKFIKGLMIVVAVLFFLAVVGALGYSVYKAVAEYDKVHVTIDKK